MGKFKVFVSLLLFAYIMIICSNIDARSIPSCCYSGIEGEWVEVSDTSSLPISVKVTSDSVYVCCKESGCLMSSDKIAFLRYDIYNKLVLESGETIRYSIIGKDEITGKDKIIMHLGIEKVGLKKVYCTEEEKRRNDAALVNAMRERYSSMPFK